MKWLNKFFNERNISKWFIFDWIPSYKAKVARGNQWVSFVQTYIPLQYIVPILGLKLAIVDKYPIWLLAIGGTIYSVGFELIKWIIGHYDMKHGIWERESRYSQTNETIAPFNYELKNTIKSIAKKVKAKIYFND